MDILTFLHRSGCSLQKYGSAVCLFWPTDEPVQRCDQCSHWSAARRSSARAHDHRVTAMLQPSQLRSGAGSAKGVPDVWRKGNMQRQKIARRLPEFPCKTQVGTLNYCTGERIYSRYGGTINRPSAPEFCYASLRTQAYDMGFAIITWNNPKQLERPAISWEGWHRGVPLDWLWNPPWDQIR